MDFRRSLLALVVALATACAGSHSPPVVSDAGAEDAPAATDAGRPPHWEEIGSAIACTEHTATPIAGGDVLIVGACTLDGEPVWALRYRAADRVVHSIAPIEPRHGHAAVPLDDGDALLIAGASLDDEPLASTERFDAAADGFRVGPSLSDRRAGPAALRSGDRVIVAGGRTMRDDPRSLVASVESIDLETGEATMLAPLRTARERMVLVETGRGLAVVGGLDVDGESNVEHLGSGEVEMLPTRCPSPAVSHGGDVVCDQAWLDLSAGVRVVATTTFGHMAPAVERLADGSLLVIGSVPWTVEADAHPEQLALGTSTALPSPGHSYLWPTATLLTDGTVLVVGEERAQLFVPW